MASNASLNKPLCLFFDRDDTLAPAQDRRIPEEICQILYRLEKLGHKIFISSDKPAYVLLATAMETGLERIGVCGENGAFVLNDGLDDRGLFPPASEMLIVDEKTRQSLLKLRQEMTEKFGDKALYPGRWFQPNTFNPTCFYVQGTIAERQSKLEKREDERKAATALKKNQKLIDGLNADVERLRVDIANALRLRDDLIAFFQGKKRMSEYAAFELNVHPNAVEMVAPLINKGTAIERIREKHGIPLERTVSFGDSSNDVPMFRSTGYSYGINLKPQILNEASENHTGIINALKAFVQKFLPQDYDFVFSTKKTHKTGR